MGLARLRWHRRWYAARRWRPSWARVRMITVVLAIMFGVGWAAWDSRSSHFWEWAGWPGAVAIGTLVLAAGTSVLAVATMGMVRRDQEELRRFHAPELHHRRIWSPTWRPRREHQSAKRAPTRGEVWYARHDGLLT